MPHDIVFSDRADDHLNSFKKRDKQTILEEMFRHLVHQPAVESKKRKRLRSSLLATWELRIGDFRVFYDVLAESAEVKIVAIGEKIHNVLKIGGEEVQP